MKFWSYGWFLVKQPKTNQSFSSGLVWLIKAQRTSLLTLVLREDAPLPDGVVGGEALLGDGGVGDDGHGQDARVGDDSARGRVAAVPADVRTHWGRRKTRPSASHSSFWFSVRFCNRTTSAYFLAIYMKKFSSFKRCDVITFFTIFVKIKLVFFYTSNFPKEIHKNLFNYPKNILLNICLNMLALCGFLCYEAFSYCSATSRTYLSFYCV